MRVLQAGNLANDGWSLVKGLRSVGVEADLLCYYPSHVASLPHWEEIRNDGLEINPYDPDVGLLNNYWHPPSYVKIVGMKRSYPFSRTVKWLKLVRRLAECDLTVLHAPFAKIAPLHRLLNRKPFVIYDAGWIRYLHSSDEKAYRLVRAGYRMAEKLIFTNVDTYGLFIEHGYPADKLVYSPFAIDVSIYKPRNVRNFLGHRSIFFMPSRPNFAEKGTDKVLYAFSRYVKREPKSLLLMIDWGTQQRDALNAKRLVNRLDLEGNVSSLGLMPKRWLVQFYNMADAVLDQFSLGALGTTGPEAMACGKPLVAYVREDYWTRWHGSAPPVFNAYTVDEIFDAMVAMEDEKTRRRYGRAGLRWVRENCEMRKVAKKHVQIYEEVLGS